MATTETMSVLLTGPTGAVGREVLAQLAARPNTRITLFDKRSPAAEKLLAPYAKRARIVWGDIADAAALAPACEDQDAVIHLAAIIPPLADENPALAERVNVAGTRTLIAALESASPQALLLYASSISVYGDRIAQPWITVGDPLQPSLGDEYAKTKIAAEALVQGSRLAHSIFRLTAIMGYGNHKLTGLLFHMPLDTPMEIATPQDTARAFVHALDHRAALAGRIFNLGGGAPCRILFRDFLQRSFDCFGLGRVDFPERAFATANFHCGYYTDSDDLEAILHFRRDTLGTYFTRLRATIPAPQRWATRLAAPLIKRYLLTKSEPLEAWKTKDPGMMRRFFGS